MVRLRDRQVEAIPVLGLGQMDVAFVDVSPFNRHGFGLAQSGVYKKLVQDAMNGVGKRVDVTPPRLEIIDAGPMARLFISLDGHCRTFRQIVSPTRMIPDSAKIPQDVVGG